jgi:hypothetical protein
MIGTRQRLAMACGLAALVTAAVWAVAATWYVGAERIVYWWDYMMWWKWTVMLMGEMLTEPAKAVDSVRRSLSLSEYPLLPAIPLAAWCAAAGTTRLPFVLGITTIYGSAAAAALAFLCLGRRAMATEPADSSPHVSRLGRAAVPIVVFVLWPLPFVVTMRGFVDLGAVAISWLILALFFSAPQARWNIGRWLAIGSLLAVLFVFRRYWAFWVTSFAVVITLDALWQAWHMRREPHRAWLRPLAGPATIGAASAGAAAIIAWPMIVRVLNTPYADIYSAYQMPAAGGFFAEIARSFDDLLASNGVLATCAGVASLAALVARRDTRRIGLVLATIALVSYIQFRRVQGAGHHHHLLWSSLLTAATAILATALAAQLPPRRAWGLVAGLAVIGALQWAAAAVPDATPLRFLVRGSSSELPLVRTDLVELERLVTAVDRAAATMGGGPQIYCLASSAVLNSNILYSYSPSLHKPFRSALLVEHTSDIDRRDGFPAGLVAADIVIACDPPQVHQGEENQQVIVEPVRQMLAGAGIGAPFERVPVEFELEGGVKTYLYVRMRAMERKHVAALSAALREKYPDRPFVYEYRAN